MIEKSKWVGKIASGLLGPEMDPYLLYRKHPCCNKCPLMKSNKSLLVRRTLMIITLASE